MFKFSAYAFLLIPALMLGTLACTTGHAATVTIPGPATDAAKASKPGEQNAVIAGGCFWGVQAVFQHVKGVISATSGYSGGEAKTAEYEVGKHRRNWTRGVGENYLRSFASHLR